MKTIKILQFMNSIIPNLKLYGSFMLKILKFKTSNEGAFLVFGVSNAKYLTFSTLDANAIGLSKLNILYFVRIYLKGKKKKYFEFGMRDMYVNK